MFDLLQITADKWVDILIFALGVLWVAFLFLIGFYFNTIGSIKDNKSSIKGNSEKIDDELKRFSSIESDIMKVKSELQNCRITEDRVKGIYKSITELTERIEKNHDQMREMVIKLFETKQDKK